VPLLNLQEIEGGFAVRTLGPIGLAVRRGEDDNGRSYFTIDAAEGEYLALLDAAGLEALREACVALLRYAPA
jgi:hypothetical protein